MADEDKEKAEKLAAAKKRFEQLKKEKNAKAKKGAKKKGDKTEESKTDAANEGAQEADPATEEQETEDKADNDGETGASKADPHSEVQELYRKQASKIEELERENKALKEQQEEGASKLAKTEEELDSLREGSSDLASLRSKAKDVDRLTTELATAQRQLQQQSSKPASTRRQSTVTPDISKELASKTSTIESLELEISNLRNQLTTLETTHSASTAELTDRATTAEAATASTKQELDALKVSLSFPSSETDKEDPEALAKRISVLESDLRTANTSLEAAAQKATSLESKIQTLTKLHKDAMTTSQQKDKELTDLRSQLKRRDRPSHVHPTDTSDFELGEEETETGALHAKIRALEAENFDLKRGVWRDRRASLQPGMDDGGPGYEDVDLTPGPYSPGSGRGSLPRQTSTFQDVITSGISAFTGRPREMPQRPAAARERAESMGLLDDDDGFDEEAFRLAQEEEAKRRIERIKEVKRGLDQWKGWRVDLVDSRQNGLGPGRDVGPIFEV